MKFKLLHRAFSWYFSKSALPYWSVLALDCGILLASGMLAYILNHGLLSTASSFIAVLCSLLLFMVVFIVCFRVFRTYMGVFRFSSFVDLQRLGIALFIGMLGVMWLQYFIMPNDNLAEFYFSDILLTCLMGLTIMWSVRIWVKRIFDAVVCRTPNNQQRVFIYGVLTGGVALAKSIRRPESKFELVGFISDDKEMKNHSLMGVPVFHNDDSLVEELKKRGATGILVSPLKREKLRNNTAMVDALLNADIRLYMVPEEDEWDGHSDIAHSKLQEVKIEDLLPREEIQVDMDALKDMLGGKRILVTGAAGSIGSEIAQQIASFGPEALILIDQAETPLHDIRLKMAKFYPGIVAPTIVADICNATVMDDIFRRFKPEYVFHAAAYKHVPMMEDNPMESIRNNVMGTKIVADLALTYNTAKFVMVSTDKAVNPTNVMGASKRICEIYVQSLDNAVCEGTKQGSTRYVTTRFGNVLGSNGSVIPLFKEQIKNGGPVTVTHPDIIRYFMLIPEACKLVLEAGSMGKGGEIFVFDMGNPVKIADLAMRMIQLSGARDIEIKYTGLRDGEKLYEEVLNDEELTLPTFHSKIKIAKVRKYDFEAVREQIEQLIHDADRMDDMHTVSQMKQIVPEFKSNHSKYENLD
ncbi:MAG: polysaccharide biosynthesis protein [Muribaculaceae bacterium]|nr:polysaccharide biosynthesis protein [Muribaculaceae bacterium]